MEGRKDDEEEEEERKSGRSSMQKREPTIGVVGGKPEAFVFLFPPLLDGGSSF